MSPEPFGKVADHLEHPEVLYEERESCAWDLQSTVKPEDFGWDLLFPWHPLLYVHLYTTTLGSCPVPLPGTLKVGE